MVREFVVAGSVSDWIIGKPTSTRSHSPPISGHCPNALTEEYGIFVNRNVMVYAFVE